jgi:hypothetical protein
MLWRFLFLPHVVFVRLRKGPCMHGLWRLRSLTCQEVNIHGLISHSRRTLPFTVTTPSSRDTGAVLRVLGRVCSLLRFDVNHRLWPLASQYTTAPSNYKFAI